MRLFTFIILFLYQSFAIATPLANENSENLVHDLSRKHSPRNMPHADLERRQTTIPNLVPTTTVKLSTHSAGTAKQTTNTNAFAIMGSHRATASSTSIPASSAAAQTTSSKGGASSSNSVPLAGILLLGLFGF